MKEGWEIKKLGEVCKIQTGKLDANAKVDDGEYPFFTCDSKPYRIDKFAFDDEAILISGNGSLVGHVNYYNGKFNAYQRTYVLTQFSSYYIPFLISYLKGYLRPYIMENKKGGCIPYITLPILQNFSIPTPPLSEQEQIVAELDLISGVIDKKKQQLKELDSLAQSIFYEMFGDPVENEKGWEVKKLGEVCEDKKKILKASKEYATNDKINYIDISTIDNINNTITTPTSYIFKEAPSRAQQVVELGDIIISMVRPNLKNIAIVNCKYNNLIASSGFCVLRAKKEITIPFLFYIVKSDAFTTYLMNRVAGANYPAIRESDISNYISILPPLSLQQQFAEKIEVIEKQKELIKQSIKETETLFDSRMDYYFNS